MGKKIKCKECGRLLPVSMFHKSNTVVRGYQSKCKECFKEWRKKYHKIHPELPPCGVSKRKQWYYDIKAQMSCLLCGESETVCLEFHHIYPKNKVAGVHKMVNAGKDHYTKKEILEEMKKCVVLCSNCHKKVHAGILAI